MAIEDTKKLKIATTLEDANAALAEGWKLLALFDRKDGNNEYTEWHLGWQKKVTVGILPSATSVPLKL